MAISYTTKPLDRYYLYNNTGTIYEIRNTKPTDSEIIKGGGVFYPEKYDKNYYDSKDESTRLKVISKGDFKNVDAQYKKTTITKGVVISEWVDLKDKTIFDADGNGEAFNSICSAVDTVMKLPRIVAKENYYTGKINIDGSKETNQRTVVYYFDYLISKGDVYDKDTKKFNCQDLSEAKEEYTNYDGKLKKLIVDGLNLNKSANYLKSIPNCIKDNTSVKENFQYENTKGFCMSSSDFEPLGNLFQDKLKSYLKEIGDSKIAIAKEGVSDTDSVKNITLTITTVKA